MYIAFITQRIVQGIVHHVVSVAKEVPSEGVVFKSTPPSSKHALNMCTCEKSTSSTGVAVTDL
eukprot:2293425-Pyramimonas_sp.AAC.1